METIYNIFLFFKNGHCEEVGYVTHQFEGTDEAAGEFLREGMDADLKVATRLRLSTPFTHGRLVAGQRLGTAHHLFDDIFQVTGARVDPMMLVTQVVDGVVRVNYTDGVGPLDMNDVSEKLGASGVMVDWLLEYTSDAGIDLPRLIHDDYFLAIKATFNAKLYVSSMKLLLSCIDSLAYVQFGHSRDQPPVFVRWLNAHAELARIGISSEELWEMRNGIVHMTNIHSAKVRSGKVRRISFGVNVPDGGLWSEAENIFYFNFYGLIKVVGDAIGHWLTAHLGDVEWFAMFIERYDETVSDSRVALSGRLHPTARQATA